jgi:hypothetical protein
VTLRHRERHEGKRNLRSVLFLVGRFDEIEGRNPVGLVYFCAWSLNGLTLGVATDDVFEAELGGFPRSRSEPRSRKKLRSPGQFPCTGASSCQPGSYRGVGFARRPFCYSFEFVVRLSGCRARIR